MLATELAAWSQIVASFAVLATLVYLTIQLRQNADLMRAESRQAMMGHTIQELLCLLDHPDIVLTEVSEDEPGPKDKVRLFIWLNMAMRAREHEWIQFHNGVLDEETWASYKQVIPIYILGTPRARRWWRAFGHNQYHPDFCQLVDTLLAEHPDPQVMSEVVAFT